jgi:hypothetical protein
MTVQPGANLYTQGFGSYPENVEIPVISQSNPSTINVNYPIGKRWINTSTNTEFTLTSVTPVQGILTPTWTAAANAASVLTSLGSNSGTAFPFDGVINIIGDGTTIQTSGILDNITVALVPDIETNFSLNTDPGNANSIHLGSSTGTGNFIINAPLTGFNVVTAGNPINIGVGATSADISIGHFGVGNSSNLTLAAGTGGLYLEGNIVVNTLQVAANYTMNGTESGMAVNTTGGPITITFPAAPPIGSTLSIFDVSGDLATNNCHLDGNGHDFVGQGIAPTAVYSMIIAYQYLILIYNGVNWNIKI